MSLLQTVSPRTAPTRTYDRLVGQRPHLEVVRMAGRRASQVPFVVLGAVLLTLGLLAALLPGLPRPGHRQGVRRGEARDQDR